jgi:prepilin-type N-terminal cleavage/methylation domain-containing protein
MWVEDYFSRSTVYMNISFSRKGFTLVELLAVIAIMAVLIVAALPYTANYTLWAQATAEQRDAQVVAGSIARWIAIGADTTGGTGTPGGFCPTGNSQYNWGRAVASGRLAYPSAWTNGSVPAGIIEDLVTGWTVITTSSGPYGNRDPFISPSTSFTQLGKRIMIAYTDSRHWTVTGRTSVGFGY